MRQLKLITLFALILALFVLSDRVSAETQTAWQATYWNNSDLAGQPVLSRAENYIFNNWGKGSPAPGTVNVDAFSARWTRTITVGSGTYRFDATADDGMRVYVDGTLLIDNWYNHTRTTISNYIYLTSQPHTIVVEYYEAGGDAVAQLSYDKVLSDDAGDDASAGLTQSRPWQGLYFDNPGLRGDPAFVREDATIDFNWGSGSPASNIPINGFSVRWHNDLTATAGRYRFTLTVDDGARLYVGDKLLINEWRSEAVRTVSAEMTLQAGTIPVRLDYTEAIGNAQVSLTWTLLYPTTGPVQPDPDTTDPEPVTKTATMRQRTAVRQTFSYDAPPKSFVEIDEVVQLAGQRSADSSWVRIVTNKNIWGWVPVSNIDTSYPIDQLAVWQSDW